MLTAFFTIVKSYLGFETVGRKRRLLDAEDSLPRKRACVEKPFALTNHAKNMNTSHTSGISRTDDRLRRLALDDESSMESRWEKKKPGKENHFHWGMLGKEAEEEDDDVVELDSDGKVWKDTGTVKRNSSFPQHYMEEVHLDEKDEDVVFVRESSAPEVEELFSSRMHSSLASGRSKSLTARSLSSVSSVPKSKPSPKLHTFFHDRTSLKSDKPTFGLMKYNLGALTVNPKKETKPISRLDSLSVRNRIRNGNLSRAAILKQTLPPPPKFFGEDPKMPPKWSLLEDRVKKKPSALDMSSKIDERKAYNQMLQQFTRDSASKILSSQLETPAFKMFESQLKRNFTYNKLLNHRPSVIERKHKIDFVDLSKSDDDIQEVGGDILTSTLRKKHLSISKDAQEAYGIAHKSVKVDVQRTRELIPKVSGETAQIAAAQPRSPNIVEQLIKKSHITDEEFIDDLMSRYSIERSKIKKEMEKETQKVQVWNERRHSLEESIEAKLKRYMKITDVSFDEILIPEKEEKLPELTSEMLDVVKNALRKNRTCVLARSGSNTITGADIQTLADSNWLNDEVINNYMDMLIQRGQSKEYPSIYAFNTFFYPRLSSSGYASVKRWTKKVDLFSQDIILVPLHLEVHWALAVVDFRQKTICYYDSMNGRKNNILQLMLKYLQEERMDKKKESFDTSGWKLKLEQDIPQQRNGYDCGVFACIFAEHLARGLAKDHIKKANISKCNSSYPPFPFSQDNMPYFRKRMIYEILTGKLLQ